MTVSDALQSSGLDSIDAELLLAVACGQNRTWVIAHANDELAPSAHDQFDAYVERRRTGEPVAYILGRAEFYGRTFIVTPDVLIPRPATDLLVEQVLKMMRGEDVEQIREIDNDIVALCERRTDDRPNLIVDVGTGSGCIAITLACELPDTKIIATDISKDALNIAQQNAEALGVSGRITFTEADGLQINITQPFFLVSNPPYIPSSTKLMKDVHDFEPHSALFSGNDGADVLNKLIVDAKMNPLCTGWGIECMRGQAENLSRSKN